MASDTNDELEKLRAEMTELRNAQKEAAKQEAAAQKEAAAAREAAVAESAAAGLASAEIAAEESEESQLGELAELLEQEIRDLPTVTCLAVFTLGLLIGRIMR